MNGDGLADLVRVDRGRILYWPGRGNGTWGTGSRDDCKAGTMGSHRHLEMADSPYYSDLSGASLRLDDVNGDGLTDLVQIRMNEVDVWLNVDGRAWTDRAILKNTPASPSFMNRVRLVDLDGSGTSDILWGNGGAYQYIDLQGGQRPWLLKKVVNGIGKTTTLEWTTTTAERRDALARGETWKSDAPLVTWVVKRVRDDAMLSVAGRRQEQEVEYIATSAFDGAQREFRGFRETFFEELRDANSPTSLSLGAARECENDEQVSPSPCAPAGRWRTTRARLKAPARERV